MSIVEQFLKSSDTILGCAVVPVLAEAIKPAEMSAEMDKASWRQDCLDVFKVIEGAVEARKVAKCLGNVGEYCFPESSPNEFDLTIVAQQFPIEVYEHMKRLYESAESESVKQTTLHTTKTPSLGPLNDVLYVDREIDALWDRALECENGGFSREFRLALIRSLMRADAATALDRIRNFVIACKNASEIKLLAELVATRPSRFVFDHSDVVRAILVRSQEFAATKEVTRTLILSACGGGRTYTDTELDPEYKYILEQGDALANRFRDDPLLQPFYSEIANWERLSAP